MIFSPPPVDHSKSAYQAAVMTASLRNLSKIALSRAAETGRTIILALSFPAPVGDPLTWLSHQSATPAIYWHGRDGWEYAAAGAAHSISGRGPDAMLTTTAEAARFLQHNVVTEVASQSQSLCFFGGFAFDPPSATDDLWADGGFIDALLVLPEALYFRREHESYLVLAIVVTPLTTSEAISIELKRLNDLYWRGFGPESEPTAMTFPQSLTLADDTGMERQSWVNAAAEILQRIDRGELEKAVLARRQHWDGVPANPWGVAKALRRHTPGCHHFAFQFQKDRAFVGASPERLLRLTERQLDSECLAGTIGRGANEDEDRELAVRLLADAKNRQEHEYVVVGMRDALQPLCCRLDMPATPEIVTLATLQHLHTPMSATLKENVPVGEVLSRLHPTPAVAGWPRVAAMQAIRGLERTSRGWYAAPVGWIGADAAEFAVGIRSALLTDRTAWLFAGAGLVKGSDPEDEWRETTDKLKAFLTALQGW